jgi:hypothetical protein
MPSEFTTEDRASWMKRKVFDCPHCHNTLVLPVSVNLGDPVLADDALAQESGDWRAGLTAGDVTLVESLVATGAVASFEVAVRREKLGAGDPFKGKPERFILTFFKTAVPKLLPGWALSYYVNAFGGRITAFGAQGILAICSDGELRAFAPVALTIGRKVRSAGTRSAGGGITTQVDEREFQEWNKSKFGYLAGKGLFYQAMKKRSLGEFAAPNI